MQVDKTSVAANREDISRFVVHLTRDDRADFTEGGALAIENLKNILGSLTILATRPHCLHKKLLQPPQVPEGICEAFNVACFTEVPLSQIHLLTQEIKGTSYQREPYGLVFNRSLLIAANAQPAIYVNSYQGQQEIRAAFDDLFQSCVNTNWQDTTWRILPFVNAMHEKYDFTWEREWRTCGHFKFKIADVVALILPENGHDDTRQKATSVGIPCISPGWTYEQIIDELSRQQKATRDHWKEKKPVKKS